MIYLASRIAPVDCPPTRVGSALGEEREREISNAEACTVDRQKRRLGLQERRD